jgi:hypothetical protein
VTAPATRFPDVRPSNSQGPVRTLTAQTPLSALPKEVEKEPGTPVINGGSATPDENTLRRLAVVLGLGDEKGVVDESAMQLMRDPDRSKAWKVVAENQKQKLKDLEYRRGLRAQALIMIKRDHGGLAQELGLSKNEAERLFELLADNQVARAAEGGILGNHMDQQELQEALRISLEFDRREEESIQALLGDKYAQWQTYEENRLAPMRVTYVSAQVTYVNTQLAQAGKPLTAAQNRALTTTFTAEEQRKAQERRIRLANPANQAQSVENSRPLLDVIAPHVNADQLAVLREQIEGRQP